MLGVLIVLGLGAWLARTLVMQQYYVGVADNQVAIYQGVRGTALGIPLQTVAERSDIELDDLPQTVRSQVTDGIVVHRRARRRARHGGAPARPDAAAVLVAGTRRPPPVGAPAAPRRARRRSTTTPLPTVRPEPGTNCRNTS